MAKPKIPKKHKREKRKQLLSPLRRPDYLTIEQWQTGLRSQFAQIQKLRVKNTGAHPAYSDFSVFNPQTKKEYRVAIRGTANGVNFCSCPDFAINTLGTCKHIEAVLVRLGKDKNARAALKLPYTPHFTEIYLRYGAKREVVFFKGEKTSGELLEVAHSFFNDQNILTESGVILFDQFIKKAKTLDPQIHCFDDALQFIAEWRDSIHRAQKIDKEYNAKNKVKDDTIVSLPFIKVPLYQYQFDGAIFAARAGRAIIADEMGLGKTIQAIAAAEIMARNFDVEKVLIICPTSLKYQWKLEIDKFCSRDTIIVDGQLPQRLICYESKEFYTVVNYEQVYRDLHWINRQQWDLIILDETQRIKNWKTRTSQAVKALRSQYALALTGTPIENRLEELHSIVSFIDRFKLGPLFRFLEKHQLTDAETGKVTGYRNLSSIGDTLSSVLVRRTKKQVLTQLPERLDKTFFVPMTPEQMAIHQDNANVVAQVVARWRKFKHLSESDQRKLMAALQYMRMSCDSTYLIDKGSHFGPKLDELTTFLGELFVCDGEKVVIFSQWHRMHDLVAQVLEKNNIGHVFLHGGVPAKKRGELVAAFKNDPDIKVFLSTDAGGTGLNLQNAATVINIDLPWNPAVLEQRIGRVHRLGQHKPVRVINFVSEGTIEHGMLNVLAFKRSLFAGVLDGGDDSIYMGESRLNRFMKDVATVAEEVPVVSPSMELQPENVPAPENPEALEENTVEDLAVQNSATIASPSPDNTLSGTIPVDTLRDILSQGATLLQELAKALSSNNDGSKMPVPMIEKDTVTSKQYLKLPLPEPQILSTILAQFSSLFKDVNKG